MDNKNIAILVTGIIEVYQDTVLEGISNYLKDKNCNVVIYQCINAGGYKEKYDIGEHNIFSLVNLDLFDGVIAFTNTFRLDDAYNHVVNLIKNSKVPVMSIEQEFENSHSVCSDNYSDIYRIIEHMIHEHNCTKINFITGYLKNVEAIERFRAYKDALAEHGIPYDDSRVYYGEFCSWDGENAVRKFYNSDNGLPEVIVCSNDIMALGAYNELKRMGIRVPEDVKITGYDNIKQAEYNEVPITSVHRQLDKVGATAAQSLFDIMEGKEVPKKQILLSSPVYTTSCGCPENVNKLNRNRIITREVDLNMSMNYLYISSRMFESLNSSIVLDELVEKIKYWINSLDCEEFYMCLSKDWLGNSNDLNNIDNNYRVSDYTDNVMPVISYSNKEFKTFSEFYKMDLIPVKISPKNKTFYYTTFPLHFQDRCFGYCVIGNSSFSRENNINYTWYAVSIINSLEIIRRESQLNLLVNKLNRLSVRDCLTGIYNRNGFLSSAKSIIEDENNKNTNIMIAFLDLDGLKQINDKYGHEEGDVALKALADILNNCKKQQDIVGRLGGDEFAFLGVGYNYTEAEDFTNTIQSAIQQYNRQSLNEFAIGASCGYYIFTPQDNMELSECIDIADGKMYKEKYKKKKKGIHNN